MKILALLPLLALAIPVVAGEHGHPGKRHARKRMMRMFVRADVNGDRQLSKSEVSSNAKLSRHFNEIDADRNGQLTPAELRAAGQARKQRVQAADRDRDRRLSREEAADLPGLAEHFDELDINRDGFVTRGEIKAARMLMREKIRLADRDGDRALSREEVKDIPRLKDNFAAIDTDKDGKLTRPEMKAWRQAHGGVPQAKKK